jgi:hypothetical protein
MMKTFNLFDSLEYSEDQVRAHAEPLFVSDAGRVLRFTFKPGQRIPEADAQSSTMLYLILKGQAVFSDEAGAAHS